MLIDLSLSLADAKIKNSKGENFGPRDQQIIKLGHYGTHLDRLLKSEIPLDYFKSRALVVDLRARGWDCEYKSDILNNRMQAGDFIIFRTGIMEKYPYGTKDYQKSQPNFSWELIRKLGSSKVHFIGLDARGLRGGEEHAEADRECEAEGIYVIENLTNINKLPLDHFFTIYTAWFDTGGSGIPCRVIAEIQD